MTTEAKIVVSAQDRFSGVLGNLRRSLGTAQDGFERLSTVATAANAAIGRIALGGVVGAAGFAAGIKQLANELDGLNDAADATGSTVENLSALEDVARRNGETLDLVTTSIVKLNQALSSAKPDSDVAKALQAIGLSAEDLKRQDPALALQAVAQSLAGYANDGNKARLVQELFGKSLREVAPFLNDLAEAGQLNSKVTAEQAEEASKFNKALANLQTEAANAGRAIASQLLPPLNDLLAKFNKTSFKGFFSQLGTEISANVKSDRLRLVVRELEYLDELQRGKGLDPYQKNLVKALREEADQLTKSLSTASAELKNLAGVPAPAADAGGGRGFVNPALVKPSLPGGLPPTAQKAQVSEAQRYLENLQKQSEALENQVRIGTELEKVTASRQLQLDLSGRRIEGVTPALEKQLRTEAKRLDVARELDKIKEREAGFQKLISDAAQREVDRGLTLLDQTPAATRDRIQRDADAVLARARDNPQDEGTQRRASEALARLRKELEDLDKPAEQAKNQVDLLVEGIEKGMDRATNAVLDFATGAGGSFDNIFKAFGRDVLRALIEEPIRDSMKNVVRIIRTELEALSKGEDGGILGSVFKAFTSGGSGGGGEGGSWLSLIGSLFGGGTSRAGGGGVKAGQLVRWQENGREWFVPGSDGMVVNPAQQRQMASAGGAVTYAPVIHVNGDVSSQTVQMMRNLIAADRAQFMRQMRTGGV